VIALAQKLFVLARRDLLSALRYRSFAWLGFLGTLAEIGSFYYLGRAVGPGFRPEGLSYYSFLIIGTGVFAFFTVGTHRFVSALHEAQMTGTLEVTMTTATPGTLVALLSATSTLAARMLWLLIYIALGFALFGVVVHPQFTTLIAALLLSFIAALGICLLAGACEILLRRGGAVAWLMGVAWFLSGTIFPVGVLPEPLRRLALLFPATYANAALRGAFFPEAQPGLTQPLLWLALFAAAILPIGVITFNAALHYSRKAGTLAFY